MAIREYKTTRGVEVYVDSKAPCLEDSALVPDDVMARAVYVEAVGPNGRAYVLKDRRGMRGPLAKSTEVRS